jgi:hypothetical protein
MTEFLAYRLLTEARLLKPELAGQREPEETRVRLLSVRVEEPRALPLLPLQVRVPSSVLLLARDYELRLGRRRRR